MARLGTALLVVGLLSIGAGGLWSLGLLPGSRTVLPAPVALNRGGSGVSPAPTLTAAAPPVAAPDPTAGAPRAAAEAPAPVPAPAEPAPAPGSRRLVPADALDRATASSAPGGYAVRLAIPAIKLDTAVEQAGIVPDARGVPTWQTLPFVAVHYGDLTSRLGQPGNAVIAGHVVTVSEGNVFRFLYQLDVDDRIDVWDERDRAHHFHVVAVTLVAPSDTSVLAPTADETLTLITCGGTFDPVTREFSDRLIVTAKPL